MEFKVYETATNRDVTEEKEWYIDPSGTLLFMTDDAYCPLETANEEYYYKLEIKVTNEYNYD